MKTTIKTAIVALALAVTVSASAEGYMFNNNLKKGMKNADVMALQTKLGVTPATGYFGNITLAAVKAYQTANALPSTGFVGSMTRGVLNSSAPVVPGTPNTPVVLNGQEGLGEYRLAPTPVNNTNIQTSVNVPVYGLEVKAKNADISVERLTLDVMVQNLVTTSYENPSTLINSITVKDGSTVLATIPVNSSTFSKYTGTSNYYVQISGLSTRVAKDTIKTFTVEFNTNAIDSSRQATLNVSANGVRIVDGRGISTYNGSVLGSRVHTFKKAGNSTATAQPDSVVLYPSNNRINVLGNGAEKVLTSTFAVKSESGPSKLTSITVSAVTTNTNPTNLYLYQGSTLLDSRTASSTGASTTVAVFDIENSNIVVNEDTISTFSVKADMPSTTNGGTLLTTTVNTVVYEKADGSSATLSSVGISGPAHFFAAIVPQFGKVSSQTSILKNGASGVPSGVSSKFVLTLTPQGGNMATVATATIELLDASGAVASTSPAVMGVLTTSGLSILGQNTAYEIAFQHNFGLPGSGVYKSRIKSITWATAASATTTQTGAFSAFDTGTDSY